MTKKELIEILEPMDDDKELVLDNIDNNHAYCFYKIQEFHDMIGIMFQVNGRKW